MNSVAWNELADTVKLRRLSAATKEMRDRVLPFLRNGFNALNDDGAPLGDNFLMSELLRYGVRDAHAHEEQNLDHAVVPGDAPALCCGFDLGPGARRAGG